jgi:hypothetical protein
MALDAPSSTRCDLCRVPFCGLNVPHRCVAAPLLSAHPAGYSDTGDLVQSATVYAAFDGNGHEVDLLLEHLGRTHTGPRDVYRDIARLLRASPRGFTPLFERGLFGDADPGAPEAPRSAVCRNCAAEVLIWGIRAWWVRERARGAIMSDVLARPDCPQGRACMRQQGDLAHAKECTLCVFGSFCAADARNQSITSSRRSKSTFRARLTQMRRCRLRLSLRTRPRSSLRWLARIRAAQPPPHPMIPRILGYRSPACPAFSPLTSIHPSGCWHSRLGPSHCLCIAFAHSLATCTL